METILIRSAQVVWEELNGQALLIHSAKGERWTLNGAALAVWKLCDGKRSVNALVQAVSNSTGRRIGECYEDVLNFVRVMCASGMLQYAGTPVESIDTLNAHFNVGSILQANYLGKGVGGARRRPSPRGNSGPG